MKDRHNNRETINVSDEYDVQDLIHALLKIFFDDIRPEEYTPSYAGKASKMDFLLKIELIVVETKMSNENLDAKNIGLQILEDIARYKTHQDCKTLICFIYDPDGRIQNPSGLAHDLTKTENNLTVIVKICPH